MVNAAIDTDNVISFLFVVVVLFYKASKVHRCRKVKNIGGQGLEFLANSQQAHDDVTTSHRRHFDVMCPLGF